MSSGCDGHRAMPAIARDERGEISRLRAHASRVTGYGGPRWQVIIVTSAFGTRCHSCRRHEH